MKAITVDGETRALRPGERLVEEPVECRLTGPELREAAVELAGLLDTERTSGAELREILRTCRAASASRQRDIARLTRLVADGTEERLRECAHVRDEAAGTIRCIRQDTLVQVWERPMTLEEKQRELFEDEIPPVLKPELAKAEGPPRGGILRRKGAA